MRTAAPLLAAWALCCAAALAVSAGHLDRPGLYYDEVIQADPAAQFLMEDGRPSQLPGARTIRLFGGWFPVRTQPYMGALKSQLLVPSFALFGTSGATLRLTTLAWALLGLLLVMAWARSALGLPVAVLTGSLIALDPSFVFVSRHDWGSFALGFAARGAALWLLYEGWRSGSTWRLAVGGLCLGLGFYNKIDFALCVAAGGAALLLVRRRLALEALGPRRRGALAVAAGAALGAAPMLLTLGGVLGAAGSAARTQRLDSPEWGEKLGTLGAMLDGSYFHRLMLVGGTFEQLGEAPHAAAGPFLAVFALAALALAGLLWRDGRKRAWSRTQAFVLATTALVLVAILLTPRAVRIHHFLNALPFPQLVVAIAAHELWRRAGGVAGRVAVASVLAVSVAGSLRVDRTTLATIVETGGKGRWSDAVGAYAVELAREPRTVAVSLDWGFDGPMRFAARDLQTHEPLWRLRTVEASRGLALRLDGTPDHVYLLFEDDYAVFPFGGRLLGAAERRATDEVSVQRHVDGEGEPAFRSVRFRFPHQLVFRRGAVEVRER